MEHGAKIVIIFNPTNKSGIIFNAMGNILSRIQEIASNEGITIGALERKIGASKGVLSRAINNGTDIQSKWVQAIVENYPQYSTRWLMAGVGDMLDNFQPDKQIGDYSEQKREISYNPAIGKPYYDVDFLGGFDEVVNSQVTIPNSNIVIQGFDRADVWCNVTGHSMEPKINHGDIIALRRCTLDDVQYGEIYAVVLDNIRTIKILRRSPNPDTLRFVPINITEYDEQEYPKKRITHIYEVIGSISKFF